MPSIKAITKMLRDLTDTSPTKLILQVVHLSLFFIEEHEDSVKRLRSEMIEISTKHRGRSGWYPEASRPQPGLARGSQFPGQALQSDALSAYPWSAVGNALNQAGDRAKAEHCFLQAARLGPHSPQILLDVALLPIDNNDRPGVSFRIVDRNAPQPLDTTTEVVKGSTGWMKPRSTFVVGPKAAMLQLQITRTASLRFDNQIGGTVWIDSVVIRRVRASHRGRLAELPQEGRRVRTPSAKSSGRRSRANVVRLGRRI
jgi:hypothetical protein